LSPNPGSLPNLRDGWPAGRFPSHQQHEQKETKKNTLQGLKAVTRTAILTSDISLNTINENTYPRTHWHPAAVLDDCLQKGK
jgi:hypothetical protein